MQKELSTILSRDMVLFESKKIYDDKIPEWIENYMKNKNIISIFFTLSMILYVNGCSSLSPEAKMIKNIIDLDTYVKKYYFETKQCC